MRKRERILGSLEAAYREAFDRAREAGDEKEMTRLDLDFQRDQIHLEALLDVRDLLAGAGSEEEGSAEKDRSLLEEGSALIEKAGQLRRMTRLR